MLGPDDLRDDTLQVLVMKYRLVHLEWVQSDAGERALALKRRGEAASREYLAACERLTVAAREVLALEREILVRVRVGAEQL